MVKLQPPAQSDAAGIKRGMERLSGISVLVNPFSGNGRGARLAPRLEDAVRSDPELRREVRSIDYTRPKGEPGPYEKIFDGADVVFVAGGDGTAHEVLNQARKHSFKGSIAHFPIGTGNDLSRTLGHGEKDIVKFLKKVAENPERISVDVYSLNGLVYFTDYASFGADARVVSLYEKLCKTLHGTLLYRFPYLKHLLYFLAGLHTFVFYGEKVREEKSGRPQSVIVLSGARTYAGGSVFNENAKVNDGKLGLARFATKIDYLKLILNRTGLYKPGHAVETIEAPFTLTFDRDVPVEISGDDCTNMFKGTREFEIKREGSIEYCV